MAEKKNQHFVPKAHFKPFTLNSECKAINVYNCKLNSVIENAPLKGQCSKNYFYGKDLKLENILGGIEGRYARLIKKITDNDALLSLSELRELRSFAWLQHHRTETNLDIQKDTYQKMDEAVHKGQEQFRDKQIDTLYSHEIMLIRAIKMFYKTLETISDLKIIIIENKTTVDFVTSDDPAILINKLYSQRLSGRAFGSKSSGLQLIMPLTPSHYLVCYDDATYNPSIINSYKVIIRQDEDAHALNELQFIRCKENVYFKNINQKHEIGTRFQSVIPHRPSTWINLWVGVPQKAKSNYYRRATEQETSSSKDRIISFTHKHLEPLRWISVLPYHSKIYGYTNGSAIGYIREGQLEEHQFYLQRERIRFQQKEQHKSVLVAP